MRGARRQRKTTTLVARIAWLVDSGVDPATIAAITFNRRAATELARRLADALAPLGLAADPVRVRTFHALGLEILEDAGRPVGGLADRSAILKRLFPDLERAGLGELNTAISRLKVEFGVVADDLANDPAAGPGARAFVAYQAELERSGSLDFDDLILGALRVLEADASLLERWRVRCGHLLVDEVQDLDRAQLGLGLLLAAPANRIFLVGDDDQSIYGWRLADVRRIFGLAARLPGLERHQLVTNYRCPRPVVERSLRLISRNRERFDKAVQAGPDGAGRLVLAPDGGPDNERIGRILGGWPADATQRAVIARTNAELVPAAAAAVERGIPFRASGVDLPIEARGLDQALAAVLAEAVAVPDQPLLIQIGRARTASASPGVARACDDLVGWAARFATARGSRPPCMHGGPNSTGCAASEATLSLTTAHSVKGLEFDHVLVLMDADRFPSHRALDDAVDSARVIEEERRLAYVAWTRARRSLTLLYDPDAPSQFLLEAFDRRELD